MIKQKLFALSGLIALLGGCYFSGNGRVGLSPESTVTPAATVTVAVTATAMATLEPVTGEPIRVNFSKGSYGATLTGTRSTKYLLWAAQGQTFTTTLTSNSTALVSLYGVDDKPLYENLAGGFTAAAKLPSSGDYVLEIRSSGAFTMGVEIR